MLRTILTTAVLALAMTGTANADCRILGIKYATGAGTYDPAGTKIYCNANGNWQTAPVFNLQARTGPDGRFYPIPQIPRYGFERRLQQSYFLYRQQQAQYDYWLGEW